MSRLYGWLFFAVTLSAAILSLHVVAHTDDLDAQTLREMYKALNSPSQLKKWKSEGGDPCEESWTGISCFGSSVIHINLQGFELTGYLGFDISNLQNLKQLDLSFNHIWGEIPGSLPLSITHLNFAGNNFTKNIPNSLTSMKHLLHLNLSHNQLYGVLGDFFGGLENLREMDLSYNKFFGDLPSSFGSLKALTRLFLQGNEFTGSVTYLADLPLSELNIQDNHFSGVIPQKFQSINYLWIAGNRFDRGAANYPPWAFPFDIDGQNISSPPTTESSAIERYPNHKVRDHNKRRLGGGKIAALVVGGTLAACAALVILIRVQRSRKEMLRSLESPDSSLHTLAMSTDIEYSSAFEDSQHISSLRSPPAIKPWHLPPVQTKTMKISRRSFSKKCKIPISAKFYTVAELQLATNSFSQENLLGEGSLGSVYRAEFPDGQILAVKNIVTVNLSLNEEEQFLVMIRTASRLRHPNIVTLLGYCVEHGQHLLVYEYIRNLSLHDALHCVEFTPLSWGLRLRIALGVARGLNYLHSSCMPPIAHSNLKAANILLDEDFRPRICDCGLSSLRPLTSNSVKLKASEMAIANRGYIAPENVQTGIHNIKADVYAFGVLLLELLTGRQPFDSSKPTEEQFLAKWASCRLHDKEFLMNMADPAIKRMITSKDLSRFADILSLCIQPEKEFRPPMSEIVDSLILLIQKPAPADGSGADPFDRSFRSSNSHFFSSPTMSYNSI